NKASDDASGLAIADKLRTQVTSINQGVSNGNSAIALLQIADKSMAEQSKILDTVKSKLIQANTATTSADGRESIRKDITKLLSQLDNIAVQTNYNGTNLLQISRGSTATLTALTFQVGENSGDIISTSAIQANTVGYSLGTLKGLAANALTLAVAASGQTRVDTAITRLNGYRGNIGSTQNQVESAVRNLMTQSTNIKAAESV
ncbi:flagellin, partial [Aliarcobacter cryaerophilus]|uniref:flagellin N-terminal helical domain-containing protein n=1 Tax=Aliarcobacter cryaerophilus TaxID=28198 RepID=UPI0021B6AB8A